MSVYIFPHTTQIYVAFFFKLDTTTDMPLFNLHGDRAYKLFNLVKTVLLTALNEEKLQMKNLPLIPAIFGVQNVPTLRVILFDRVL